MEWNDFLAGIRMMPQARKQLKDFIGKGQIHENEYCSNRALFFENRELFYEEIRKKKDYRMAFLYYYCRMAMEIYEVYQERKIDLQIYWDTFYDLTLWCENCYNTYGEYGIGEYDWFFRHIECKIFRIGRLEFEQLNSPWKVQSEAITVNKGDHIISIHIPQGEKLEMQAVIASLKQGKDFWKCPMVYLCHSWLLYPGLKHVLQKSSNILQFQNLFQIVQTDYTEREAEGRIFGEVQEDVTKYSEKTSLQKSAKRYLLSGKKLGNGLGILKRPFE